MSYESRSQLEQKAGIKEQDLIGAAKAIIWSYLKAEYDRLSAEPLIAEFIKITLETHPNPERMDCPGHTALAATASSEERDEILLKHLVECGPCLREYSELLDIASP